MSSRERRSKNFTPFERNLLLELVKQHWHIIGDKKTDGPTVTKKVKAWYEVTENYNINHQTGKRTPKQLKELFFVLKKKAQKGIDDGNIDNIYIGGRTYTPMKVSDASVKVVATLGPLVPDLNPFDSSSSLFSEDTTVTDLTLQVIDEGSKDPPQEATSSGYNENTENNLSTSPTIEILNTSPANSETEHFVVQIEDSQSDTRKSPSPPVPALPSESIPPPASPEKKIRKRTKTTLDTIAESILQRKKNKNNLDDDLAQKKISIMEAEQKKKFEIYEIEKKIRMAQLEIEEKELKIKDHELTMKEHEVKCNMTLKDYEVKLKELEYKTKLKELENL